MTNIQSRLDAISSQQERNQFGTNRYAYLFEPGDYHLDVRVGFYMQVLGLGESPDNVAITGAVRSKAPWRNGNATVNFWRAVENLSVTPTLDQHTNIWAVSQGTALRRVHVRGNLMLSDGGWSSGGFMADCKIDGQVDSGTQQQWLSRNDEWGGWTGGAWNMVFVGVVNPPAGAWPNPPYTVVTQTPLIREKPYLFVDGGGRFFVMVPHLEANGKRGITWSSGAAPGTPLPIDRFYLAHPEKDNAASINAALEQGKNLLLTPGIYHLENSIRVSRPDTVVLGLGYPTLVPDQWTPAHGGLRCGWCESGRHPLPGGNQQPAHAVAGRNPGPFNVSRDGPALFLRHFLPGGWRGGRKRHGHGDHQLQQRRGR